MAALLGAYSCASSNALKREVRESPRDPETGVVIGAEAINLGDPQARAACLLLHGFVGSRKDFSDLGERLAAAGLYVRLTRFPGHGTTPQDFATTTDAQIVAAAREELRDLRGKFPKVYVIGFSMGGAVATLLAAGEPVDRLVLVAPYYGVTYRWFYGLRAETWNRMLSPVIHYIPKRASMVRVNRREAINDLYSYRTVPTQGALTLMKLGEQASNEETLRKIQCPVLLLHSRGDEAASPDSAERAFSSIGSTSKEIVWYTPRSNHHLLSDYDREDVKGRIMKFLSAAPANPAGVATPKATSN